MKNKTKLSIGGIALALLLGGIVIVNNRPDTPLPDVYLKKALMTEAEYKELRDTMILKYQQGEEFTWQELQIFIAILDKEAKQKKFRDIKNVDEKNLVPKMINRIIQK